MIVGPDGKTLDRNDARRIIEMCALFGVPDFADDLISAGFSALEAWDRLCAIDRKLTQEKAAVPKTSRYKRAPVE